jgi:hypothetical protein
MVGRPKIVRTPEELEKRTEERKIKYFGERHNERRRERYHSDPEYREAVRARNRVTFSKKPTDEKDMRKNIPLIRQFSQKRYVKYPTGEGIQPCLTFEELASAMNRNVALLYRWRKEGKFPSGVMTFIEPEGYQLTQAFSPEEAEVILRVIGQHFFESSYYLGSHTKTRDKLFAGIEKVRKQRGFIE